MEILRKEERQDERWGKANKLTIARKKGKEERLEYRNYKRKKKEGWKQTND